MDHSTDEEFYGSTDQPHQYTSTATTSFMTKGRRTKRQRTITLAYGGGEGKTGGGYVANSYGSSASATPSNNTDEHDVMSEVTTEEEDMANCLILLAQGVQRRNSHKNSRRNNTSTSNNNNIINSSHNNNNNNTSTSVVASVYECKTCSRTFPSFQALGGHRTSHKKVKVLPTASTATTTVRSPKVDDHVLHNDHERNDRGRDQDFAVVDEFEALSHESSPPLPSQVHANMINNMNHHKNDKGSGGGGVSRVHECSICGSEFPSGQALGGHMRRHRAAATPPLPSTAVVPDRQVVELSGPRNILSLDLNLPAPHDHDEVDGEDSHMMVETKFHVVLPTPALVDCHY